MYRVVGGARTSPGRRGVESALRFAIESRVHAGRAGAGQAPGAVVEAGVARVDAFALMVEACWPVQVLPPVVSAVSWEKSLRLSLVRVVSGVGALAVSLPRVFVSRSCRAVRGRKRARNTPFDHGRRAYAVRPAAWSTAFPRTSTSPPPSPPPMDEIIATVRAGLTDRGYSGREIETDSLSGCLTVAGRATSGDYEARMTWGPAVPGRAPRQPASFTAPSHGGEPAYQRYQRPRRPLLSAARTTKPSSQTASTITAIHHSAFSAKPAPKRTRASRSTRSRGTIVINLLTTACPHTAPTST